MMRPFAPMFLLSSTIIFLSVPLGASAEPRLIELSIRERVLPAEQRVIRVRQDDDVTLRWTTNHPIALHLHGYDIEQKLKPGEPATMTFRARATGRFPITVHGVDPLSAGAEKKERVLGYLEVHPR